MSKISRENKKKAKKTTASEPTENVQTGSSDSKFPNYGKCCTCKHFGKPCQKTGKYVARKLDACASYKFKNA